MEHKKKVGGHTTAYFNIYYTSIISKTTRVKHKMDAKTSRTESTEKQDTIYIQQLFDTGAKTRHRGGSGVSSINGAEGTGYTHAKRLKQDNPTYFMPNQLKMDQLSHCKE